MAKSPRKKTTALANEEIAKNPRKSPRCSKCPSHPLRSQCTHTAKGRQFLLEQTAQTLISNGPMENIFSQPLPSVQPSPTRLTITVPPILLTTPQSASSVPTPEPVEQGGISPPTHTLMASAGPIPIHPSLLMESPVEDRTGSPPSVTPTSPVVPLSFGGHGTTVNGPVLLANTTSVSFLSPTTNSEFYPTEESSMSISLGPYSSIPSNTLHTPSSNDDETSAFPSSPVMSSSPCLISTPRNIYKNKKRATASNPIHGHVTGVMRGASSTHEIHRTHKAPLPVEKSSSASKAFLESINSIFAKCEDISLKTGCWLFIGAQHANAVGGALHYASPRLIKDGRQETNEFASQFLELIKHVSDSRKVDVLELQGQLRKSQHEMAAMEASRNSAEAKLQAALEDMEKLKATSQQQIQEYRAGLGLAP